MVSLRHHFQTVKLLTFVSAIYMKNKFGFLPPPTREVPLKSDNQCFGEDDKYALRDLAMSHIQDFCTQLGNTYKPGTTSSFAVQYNEGLPEHVELKAEWGHSSAHLSADDVEAQCMDSIPHIIDDCDTTTRWKHGGAHIWGDEAYVYYVTPKHERPTPAPEKVPGKCDVWYKFWYDEFYIYGGGWAGDDHGQSVLLPRLRDCGVVSEWRFDYYPDIQSDGMEWNAYGRIPIGAQQWDCVRKAVVAAGGPADIGCGGS
jgi:hypothetical protein